MRTLPPPLMTAVDVVENSTGAIEALLAEGGDEAVKEAAVTATAGASVLNYVMQEGDAAAVEAALRRQTPADLAEVREAEPAAAEHDHLDERGRRDGYIIVGNRPDPNATRHS